MRALFVCGNICCSKMIDKTRRLLSVATRRALKNNILQMFDLRGITCKSIYSSIIYSSFSNSLLLDRPMKSSFPLYDAYRFF